ncbi:MAG: hypothetical protein ABI968_05640 [Acidobacteriota bacterium]
MVLLARKAAFAVSLGQHLSKIVYEAAARFRKARLRQCVSALRPPLDDLERLEPVERGGDLSLRIDEEGRKIPNGKLFSETLPPHPEH